MGVIDILQILGGIAVFLFGMNLMGSGLERLAGGRLEKLLKKVTSNTPKAILLGTLVTAIIQSSSATTVLVVGFVNSGLMTLRQAIGVCLGANIGTTVTSWIISLAGINSDNLLLAVFKPINLAAICALIGIVLYMFLKNERRKDIGFMLLGFAVLMFGMNIMSSTAEVLTATSEFQSALVFFENPIFGFLTGLILTAIIQSSSASIGMLQAIVIGSAAVAGTGKAITFAIAIPIILGQNVGTCITAVLSGIGARKNAMRAAVANVYVKLFGAIIIMGAVFLLNSLVHFSFWDSAINETEIAIVHTTYNILTTFLVLPFIKWIEKLAVFTVREKNVPTDEHHRIPVLDERLLQSPTIAISQCSSAIAFMSGKAKENLLLAMDLLRDFDTNIYKQITENEDIIDLTEDELGTYLIKITDKDLSAVESVQVSKLLHSIADYERIGDHAMNIAERAKALKSRGLAFSPSAMKELAIVREELTDILDTASVSFNHDDYILATEVEPMEEAVDSITALLKDRHINRLRTGECTIETGIIFLDLLNDFERIADHCSNLAVYVIEIKESKLDAHEYLRHIKLDNAEFIKRTEYYTDKYWGKLSGGKEE